MGTYPISLLTVPVLGYLAAILTGNWAKGLTFGMLIHVVWVEIWNNGAGFVAPPGVLPPGSPPIGDLLVYYFWATLLMSIVGAVEFWIFNWHPLLDGFTMVSMTGKGATDYTRTGARIAKILLVLLIFFGSHVIFELHTEDFPAPWGGVVCTVGVALGWVVFFLLLRSEYKSKDGKEGLFEKGSPNVHTTAMTFMNNELSVFILFASLGHIIYITAYWIWEFTQGTIQNFITSLWYFYASLIIAGAILIIMLLVGYFLVKRPASKRTRKTADDEPYEDEEPTTPLVNPSTLPPPIVEPSPETSQFRVGTYKNPW
jgi:NADH:ubiquinone oxidoreductase subunit 3 (subunit A)